MHQVPSTSSTAPSLPLDASSLAQHKLARHVSESFDGLGFLTCVLVMLGSTTAVLGGHTVGRLCLPSGGTGSTSEPSGYLRSLHLLWL